MHCPYLWVVTDGMSEVPFLRAVPHDTAHTADHASAVAALFDAAAEVTAPPHTTITVGPTPQRLAPYAFTLLADLSDDESGLSASGRFVLLHDPAGHPGWQGSWRVVSYLRAEVDEQMAADPLLPEVAWTWMQETWQQFGVDAGEPSGTVTCTQSRPFGQMDDRSASADVEIRCSWTPVAQTDGLIDVVANVKAWLSVMSTAAGLPQT